MENAVLYRDNNDNIEQFYRNRNNYFCHPKIIQHYYYDVRVTTTKRLKRIIVWYSSAMRNPRKCRDIPNDR